MKKSVKALSLVLCMLLCVCAIVILAACDNGDGDTKDADDKYNDEYAKYNWVCSEVKNGETIIYDRGTRISNISYARDFEMSAVAQFIDKKTLNANDGYGDKATRSYFKYIYSNDLDVQGYVYVFPNISLRYDKPDEIVSCSFSKKLKAAYFTCQTDFNFDDFNKLDIASDGKSLNFSESGINNFTLFAICDFSDNKPLVAKFNQLPWEKANGNESIHLEAQQTKIVTLNVAASIHAYFGASKPVTVTHLYGDESTHAAETVFYKYKFSVDPTKPFATGFDYYEKGENTFLITNNSNEAIDFNIALQSPPEIRIGETVDIEEGTPNVWYRFTIPSGKTYYNNSSNTVINKYIDGGRYCMGGQRVMLTNETESDKQILINVSFNKNVFDLCEVPVAVGYKVNGEWLGWNFELKVGVLTDIGFYVGKNEVLDALTSIVIKDGVNKNNYVNIVGDIVSNTTKGDDVVVHVRGAFTMQTTDNVGSDSVDIRVSAIESDGTVLGRVSGVKTLLTKYGYGDGIDEGSEFPYGDYLYTSGEIYEDSSVYDNLKFNAIHDEIGIGVECKLTVEEYKKLYTDFAKSELEDNVFEALAFADTGFVIENDRDYPEDKVVLSESNGTVSLKKYFVRYNRGKQNALYGISSFKIVCIVTLYSAETSVGFCHKNTVRYYSVTLDLSNDANWQAFVSRNRQ